MFWRLFGSQSSAVSGEQTGVKWKQAAAPAPHQVQVQGAAQNFLFSSDSFHSGSPALVPHATGEYNCNY